MAKTFEGKTVLVTGGCRGLGAAIARAFAESGADVAISYVASDEKAQAVIADVWQLVLILRERELGI